MRSASSSGTCLDRRRQSRRLSTRLLEPGSSPATAAAVVAGGSCWSAFLAGLQIGTTGANLYKMIDTWFALPEVGHHPGDDSGDLSVR